MINLNGKKVLSLSTTYSKTRYKTTLKGGFRAHLSALGPGIILAASAVGGSHIIASTQAGAQFGFQLAGFIIAVNVLKYPFYAMAFHYSLCEGQSVLSGYAEKGRYYLPLFLLFNVVASLINIAAGTLLSAVLLQLLLPLPLSITGMSILVLVSFLFFLRRQPYQVLDRLSKHLMLILSVVTILALILAWLNYDQSTLLLTTANALSPWTIAGVPFLIALMGWMPAPMELSVASSLWVVEKNQQQPRHQMAIQRGLLDFNVGYGMTLVLALVFMALGAYIQYGQALPIEKAGRYILQFIELYASSIGEWTRWWVSLIAFLCIYGTTITAVEGYSRGNQTALALLTNSTTTMPSSAKPNRALSYWMIAVCLGALIIILWFQSSVKHLISFAMTMSFVSAPVFAWLNVSLYRQQSATHAMRRSILMIWAWVGLMYLIAMLVIYGLWLSGWLDRFTDSLGLLQSS